MQNQDLTTMTDPELSLNQPMQNPVDHKLSNFSRQLQSVTDFILIRQNDKNSLSKLKLDITKNHPKEKANFSNVQNFLLKRLIEQVSENLHEGHTIFVVQLNDAAIIEHIPTWQQQKWLTVLNSQNPITAVNTPLVMQYMQEANQAVFWLHREWAAERQLAQRLLAIALQSMSQSETIFEKNLPTNRVGQSYPADANIPTPNAQQQQAIENAKKQALSIITGGPGTGKTFTVAQLVLARLAEHEQAKQHNPTLSPLSIALTAPTGKAAQRMRESLAKSMPEAILTLDNAKTLHRLLGIGQHGVPRYDANHPLPYDVVIVDEASMLGLELASQLAGAIKPSAQLILLGDANQLAAVDAGAVLADLCQVEALRPYHTELTESKRFAADSELGQLARVVLQPNSNPSAKFNQAKQLLTKIDLKKTQDDTAFDQAQLGFDKLNTAQPLRWLEVTQNMPSDELYRVIAAPFQNFFAVMRDWQSTAPDIHDIHDAATRQQLLATFDDYRVLSAGHRGQLGTRALNKILRQAYFEFAHMSMTRDFFYHGVPIMVNKNDYQLGLFNGDIGICVQQDNTVWVCFAEQVIDSRRLSQESCEWAYALSIHKSQGSEFDHVAVCLDLSHQRLLSQELVYTAITRSRGEMTLVSSSAMFRQAITQQGSRQTGLRLQFDGL